MPCPAPETFSAFVSGQLPEAARDALDLHVDVCASCRITLSELGRRVHRAAPVEQTLGRYTVSGELGAGAMGVVYLAHDPELARDVAIKLVHPQVGPAESELVQQRVLREGRALARIAHVNVVRVFDVGRAEGALFVAMERAPGVSLRVWLSEPRPVTAIVDVFVQCARGLAAAHAAGVVHRDFKPDNVVVDTQGHARVTDFGLAQTEVEHVPAAAAEVHDPRVTRTRGIVGTPAYMAPEQHRGEPIDARADQFAWGVAFAEALMGRRPFTGSSRDELLAAMRRPVTIEAPRRVRRVVMRALAFEPAARFPTMTAAADALAARRHIGWLGTGGVLLAMLVLLWVARTRRDVCADVDGGIAAIWSAARAHRLDAVFAASTQPFAADAWRYARARTDAYATRWKTVRVGVCRAGVERGELDAATRARVVQCLDRRVGELDAVLVRWESSPETAPALPAMIDAVAAPEACQTAPVDGAPAGVQTRFAAASAAASAGKPHEAEAQLRALEPDAVPHPALHAELLVALGGLERELGKAEAGRAHLVAGLAAAEAARADRLRALALVKLAQSSADDFDRPADARESLRLARAVIAHLDDPPDLIRLHDAMTGLAALRANDAPAAVEALRRSIHDDDPPTQRATRTQMLARALIAAGDASGALAELERAERMLVTTLGSNAPTLVYVYNSMMEPLAYLGRPAEAVARGERALALYDAAYDKDSPRRAAIQRNLASMYANAGDSARGRAIEEEVLRRTLLREPGTVAEAIARQNFAISLEQAGEFADAVPHLERAKALFIALGGPDDPEVANTLSSLADAHAALGRPGEALTAAERALAIREAGNTPPGQLAYARFHVAEALAATGARARAVAMAKRALELPLGDTGREADLAKQIRSWLATHR